jgi:hypothetical protein
MDKTLDQFSDDLYDLMRRYQRGDAEFGRSLAYQLALAAFATFWGAYHDDAHVGSLRVRYDTGRGPDVLTVTQVDD